MATTTTYQPSRSRHLSRRLISIAIAVALLIAALTTVVLLVAAARDTGDTAPTPAVTVQPQPPGANVSTDCVPSKVVTPC